MNYFLLNKHEDFARGTLHQFVHSGDAIQAVAGRNVFLSRIFDAQQRDTAWHRMQFCLQAPPFACHYTLHLYTSNTLPPSPTVGTPQAWQQAMQPYLVKSVHDHSDIYLRDLHGRYLWFCIDLYHLPTDAPTNEAQPTCISDIFIYFEAPSMVQYLPEIYQTMHAGDDFLHRFLMIFQSMYEQIDAKIEQESCIYNPMSTEYLHFLAQLVGLEDVHMWEPEKLRYLLQHVKELYQIRGTRQGLLQLVSLFTDGGAYVVEEKEQGVCCVHILIKESHFKEQNTIRKIVQSVLPVGISYRITVLKDHVLMGKSTYLGVNTKLIQYEQMDLLGTSRLNYTILGHQEGTLEEHS